MKKNNIVLVGFMGTGKTVVGEALASAIGFRNIDTDAMIEAEARKTIPDIFAKEGEPAFRRYEALAIKRIVHLRHYVIAMGGGAVMMEENILNMKKAGMVVCLTATPEVVLERTRHNNYRPLLQTPDPLKKIKSLMKIRESQYQKADYTIDTSDLTVDAVVETIISQWTKEE